MEIKDLSPQVVWHHFQALNNVPRPSKKEEKVIAFMKSFGEKNGLDTYVDPAGNVIIKKPATAGMENRQTVIIQSHLDMVHQKNADTVFDFNSQGIKMLIDGEWVTADGTTLGADNGMGVAAIMSLLVSKDIKHPAIEALFTIDEETGMTGAFELEQGILNGTILLNLDTEDDDEFSIGCAGGIDTNSSYSYESTTTNSDSDFAYEISVTGLKGGHSGMDIHLERGNANKIMNRVMNAELTSQLRIVSIDGGSLRNAIPRESFAVVVTNSDNSANTLKDIISLIQQEYSISDANLKISVKQVELPKQTMNLVDTKKVIQSIAAVHNGVFRMSMAIKGLVETSSSLARVLVKDGFFQTQSLQRSSVDSSKKEIADTVGACFSMIGAAVEHTGSYPGWAPDPNSKILEMMVPLYEKMYDEKPRVQACHAGLECGILNERYPGLDMISFGPTIKNPHSPDEKVHIESVNKFWNFLLEVLQRIPESN
jgi:dipeptidase D